MFVVRHYNHRIVIMDAEQCSVYVVPEWASKNQNDIQELAEKFNSAGKIIKRYITNFEAKQYTR